MDNDIIERGRCENDPILHGKIEKPSIFLLILSTHVIKLLVEFSQFFPLHDFSSVERNRGNIRTKLNINR